MAQDNQDNNKSEERKFVSTLQRFIKLPEWEIYKLILENQIESRKKKLAEPISDNASMSEHNMLVGEIHGLLLAINLPARLTLQEEVDRQFKMFEEEKESN